MCIKAISNNFFPGNTQPTGIIATCSTIVALVSTVLVILAYTLHWGMPAAYSLLTIAGVTALLAGAAVIIPLAILQCKQLKALPDLAQHFPDALNPGERNPNKAPGETTRKDFYTLIRDGKIDIFKKALKLFDAKQLESIFVNSHSVWLDSNDQTTNLVQSNKAYSCIAYSLFHIILSQNDPLKRDQLLFAILEKLPDDYVEEHQKEIFSKFLNIDSPPVLKLCSKKFAKKTFQQLIETAFETAKGQVWIDCFINRWAKDKELQKAFNDHMLCLGIFKSCFSLKEKLAMLTSVITKRHSTFRTFKITKSYVGKICPNIFSKHEVTLLHLAIEAGDPELTAYFAQNFKPLIEQPTVIGGSKVRPLHHAVFLGNLQVVQALLDAGANPSTFLKSGTIQLGKRRGATRMTPLMIAACKRRQDIVAALLKARANPNATDGDDALAWTMQNYAA